MSDLPTPESDTQLIKINGFIYQMVTMLLKCKWLVSVNYLISNAINQDNFAVSNRPRAVHLRCLEQSTGEEKGVRKKGPDGKGSHFYRFISSLPFSFYPFLILFCVKRIR